MSEMGQEVRKKRHREHVAQARQVWLNKLVRFDVQQGAGVQYGRVVAISDEGDVLVECLPGYDRPIAALAFTLGYLHVLTLVDGQ
jgi:hypothetical protein